MNLEWSLEDLYTGFESVEFQNDLKRFEAIKEDFAHIELVDTMETVKQVIVLQEELEVLLYQMFSFINFRLSTNTTDQEASKYSKQLNNMVAELTDILTRMDRFLGESKMDVSTDDSLSHYQFRMKQLQLNLSHTLSEETEALIAMMNKNASSAWENMHNYLTSTVEGTLNGQSVTLSEVRNYAYDADPSVRKAAYEAELAMYDHIKGPIAFSLNHIKSQVNDISKLRGYSSPLAATLEKSHMEAATLKALISAMEEKLPAFRRYLKHKAKLLGHPDGLPFYDLFAPMGKASRQFTVEESREFLVETFRDFSEDLAEMTDTFYEKNYIDFMPKKGKVGGAYCANLPFLKQSRILTNFDGSMSSVVTLAHELGHAYHGLHIESHAPLNWDYSMPVAETASTFNENIVMNKLIREAKSDEEKSYLLESQLQDLTQIIVDILSRYYFETSVFEHAQSSFLFPEQLEELMLNAQDRSYGEGLDQNIRHPYMWVNKGHYYSGSLSFYNFPYAFGGLLAKGLYAKYLQDKEAFIPKYQEFLNQTTVKTVEEAVQVANIDVKDKNFWLEALSQVETSIDEWIKLTDK
ncbi:M3 family oligoendopeptidase [Atopobacter phocae]|uniref:M3 family oligoendopeptidase n=1 Tax=Atopobacter phocae TaxID=136492 RepID=UPI0004724480|nr:M3 family oligoendopeptidase [Atopobacter phocae]